VAIRLSGSADPSIDGEEAQVLSEINITPLTDIFLVLLIIFMVTSSVMSQMGVDVDLPAGGKTMDSSQPEGVIVTLLPTGKMQVADVSVGVGDWELLERALAAAFKQSSSRLVILEGDRKAFLGNAIELMDHARKAGAEKFAIATKDK